MGFDFGQLLDASLDGVPFSVQRARRRGGRRTVTHEFPGTERVQGEDLGRLPQRFVLEAFVLGDDWLDKRDALIDVLEQPGPKLLVHPSFGEKVVDLDGDYDEDEDTSEAVSRISIPLVEHGLDSPTLIHDTPVPVAADVAIRLIQQDFEQRFDPRGFLGSLLAALRSANAELRKALGRIDTALAPIDQFAAELDELDDNLGRLLATPDVLAGKLVGLIASLYSLLQNLHFRVAQRIANDIAAFRAPGDRLQTTPRRVLQAANLAQIDLLVRGASAVEAARTFQTLSYGSANDAVEARSSIGSILQALADDDDVPLETHEAIEQVRGTVSRHLTREAQRIPRIGHYTVPADTPTVVLAYRFYADSERTDEIAERNALLNPTFVGLGTEVELLDATA